MIYQQGFLVRIVDNTTMPRHDLPIGTRAVIRELKSQSDSTWYLQPIVEDRHGVAYKIPDVRYADVTDFVLDQDHPDLNLDVEVKKLLGITHCPTCGRKHDDVTDAA